ncbi:MAG: hypothetical protein AAGC63_15915 [Propionicimonas sp.]|nr:hypothetical protein [Propionicimonas sp.]
MLTAVVTPGAPAVQRLREAAAAESAAQAAKAAAILDLAREVEWNEAAEFDVVGTRPVRLGADGTPLVDEHLPLEVAAALGLSVDSAIWLIRDVVNLAARLPHTWRAVQVGTLPLWRGTDLARRTEFLALSECRRVDDAIAAALGTVGWRRLTHLLRAAMMRVAPARLRAEAERNRADRYIRTGALPDDPSSSYLAGRLDTADARGFDELLDRLADALAGSGTVGDHPHLRARAVGLLADDLGDAARLLSGAPSDPARRRPARRPHQVYVHLSRAGLSGNSVADVEGLGPVLADQFRCILGDRPIRVTPVLAVGDPARRVDCYAIPDPIRSEVVLRDRFEAFPHSSRSARSCDLDHTEPWLEGGPPGQTRAANLGPLSRRAHRGKTFGGWRLAQPRPGVYWWTSPRGQVFRVSPRGTWNLTPGGGCSESEQAIWRHLDRRRAGPPSS